LGLNILCVANASLGVREPRSYDVGKIFVNDTSALVSVGLGNLKLIPKASFRLKFMYRFLRFLNLFLVLTL